jgi:hypothetical protein
MSLATALIKVVKENNISPEDFAEVLTKCRRAGLFAKDEGNLTDTNLADIIADYPSLFQVYLDEQFGTAHIARILEHCFRKNSPTALKMFLNAPHIATAISRREGFWANRFGGIRASKECWDIILDHPHFKITTDDLLTDMWRMTDEAIIQILRHPLHSNMVYLMEDPVIWRRTLHQRLYGTISYLAQGPQFHDDQAYRMKDIIAAERHYRAQQVIRFVFWTSVLKVRVREFVERYWAPGGPKSKKLEKSFNESLAV